MTARFVRQPDGLWARFSYVSEDVTHLNLSKVEAETVAARFNMPADSVAHADTDDETWLDLMERVETAQGIGRRIAIQNDVGRPAGEVTT